MYTNYCLARLIGSKVTTNIKSLDFVGFLLNELLEECQNYFADPSIRTAGIDKMINTVCFNAVLMKVEL